MQKVAVMNELAAPLGNKQLFFVGFFSFLALRAQEDTLTNSQQQLAA